MTTTITAGATLITPKLVEGYDVSAAGQTIVHQILGRTDPDVTLRVADMRTGTLMLLLVVEADAWAAFNALRAATVCVLASDERSIGMRFVVPSGQSVGIALDTTTRNHWHVTVPFQEVGV